MIRKERTLKTPEFRQFTIYHSPFAIYIGQKPFDTIFSLSLISLPFDLRIWFTRHQTIFRDLRINEWGQEKGEKKGQQFFFEWINGGTSFLFLLPNETLAETCSPSKNRIKSKEENNKSDIVEFMLTDRPKDKLKWKL